MKTPQNFSQPPVEDIMLTWHRIVLSFVIVIYAAVHIGVLQLPSMQDLAHSTLPRLSHVAMTHPSVLLPDSPIPVNGI
ncbi:MAG: hypothetical protein ACLFM4_05995 [Phormidium sp.]|nr:MAG: hypothetical protein HLUCCO16_18170 [Phormidium sp. OSCR]